MQIKRIALGGIIMTVIMFTPTYACVGTSDGIASYRSSFWEDNMNALDKR